MPTPSEWDIQRAFTIFYKGEHYRDGTWKVLPAARPGVVAWHTPNGGNRSAAEGARFRAIGVEPGIPDYFFLWGGLFALEFKKPGGPLSAAQLAMHPLLRAAGAVAVETVDNLAAAKEFVRRHGLTLC